MSERFDIYDEGNQIGVLIRENAYRWERLPISCQGSIEDTYTLARLTCSVLQGFYNAGKRFPAYLEQFVEEESRFAKNREEYLTNLRLYLQYGGCEICKQCRFLTESGKCKATILGTISQPDDTACCIGIRKEQK